MAMHIPGYRVIRKINQGGMSTVYLAIQISVGRVVALKVMNPQLNSDPAFSERFQREATIVGQLSHPNIVAIYDIGRHEDLNYIAMDYLPNGSVHDKMSTGLSGEEVLRITREIASALDHAHEKGYIHRDIKPENVLFRADNSAVLSDFGVARGLAANSRMTHVGTVVGTPHYMSPEQTKGNSVDGRSDLYSLGIVFYEMLTGTLPYQGDEAVTIALKHISAPIPKLPMQYLAYQKILEKLLAKDPEQRFQRGRDLIVAIEDLEKNYRAPSTTVTHPADLTVMNLARALISATYNAVRWRWNKIRALRWNPSRGFYQRPSTKITEIFFNEQHTPALTVRAEIETQIHKAFSQKNAAFAKLGTAASIMIIGWCGFSIWYAKTTNANANASFTGKLALATADFFIELPTATPLNPALNTAIVSSSAQSSSTQTVNAVTQDAAANTTATLTTTSEATLAPIDMATTASASSSDAIISGGSSSSSPLITYALTVKTSPAQARVRILNIPDRYQPGILLPAGSYHIEVSQTGYDTQRTWIDIVDQDLTPTFSLTESIAPGDEISSQVITSIKSDGPEMISIPTGTFFMGNKDDPLTMPVHKVTISKPFAMSKYEITFDDYDMFAQATNRALPSDNRWGRGNRPVINVSFDDASAYVRWLSETTGKKYRLPTESEWEYVARADTNSLFWWGNDVKEASGRANCRRGCNSKFSGLFGAKTAPVGSYPANGFGIYDTAGNVAEWVEDCFTDNYTLHPKNGQAMLVKSCDSHVVRGGSAKDNAERLANHIRDYHRTEIFDVHLGFRVVMELK
ncbi:bifunctional serine/threonine-protein kinase/formylglycine-generating enzyme family protein [Cellvibrio fibrivorans]|uniref:Serine/threonine-protein kinase PpkA n=1 Tax=Cellvibrio fibrivorans TaxID=126350 RepID=A0ABU1UVH4_9GAMM|nr:bifunctional serine/threonine-protein kinase/formylglycine-generating enzyme family protein [Cellvibrio fibrivorans]MDR7089176.1 serine/threonine-protein kinase PpkA [Cellvibrio fibrivorans]